MAINLLWAILLGFVVSETNLSSGSSFKSLSLDEANFVFYSQLSAVQETNHAQD
jgi:hypothetical protein